MQRLRGPVMRVRRLLLLVLLGAGPVRAHSVSNEVALGLSEDSPASPHGPHVADQLTFRFDLSDDWSMKLGGTYTYDTATPPPEGGAFGTSSAQVLSVVGGLDWDVSPRATLYLEASGSPSASQSFDAVLALVTPGGLELPPRDVLLHNATSSVGVLAGTTFVVGGSEFLGTVLGGLVIDVSLGWTLLTTRQHVEAIVDAEQRPVSRSALLALCALAPKSLSCRTLRPYLKGGEDSLNQLAASLALLYGVGSSTDLGLAGSYYAYDQDPTTAAFFTARANAAAGDSLGAGFPLAGALVHQPQLDPAHRRLEPGSVVPVPVLRLVHREGARRGAADLLADRPDVDGLGLGQRAVGPPRRSHQPDAGHRGHHPRRLGPGGARISRPVLSERRRSRHPKEALPGGGGIRRAAGQSRS